MAENPTELLDPRIRRTRDLLQQALGKLLETVEFEKISVQDIAAAATVNRATFYAHYPDKFALLECLVAGRFVRLLQDRGVYFDGGCISALRGFVLGACDYLAQIPGVQIPGVQIHGVDRERQRQLEPHLESAVIAVIRRMILDGLRRHTPPNSDASPELLASTVSWAIFGAAKEWVRTPNRPPSEEVAQTVMRLIAPILLPEGSNAPPHPDEHQTAHIA